MDNLNLSDAGLLYIPQLSDRSIRQLNVSWNFIRLLWEENLPLGLEEINLEGNQITSDGLVADWPDTIKVINLSRNVLCTLNHVIHWPSSLRSLNISRTNITSLDTTSLPRSLQELDISYTDVEFLQSFPPLLKKFTAESTRIQKLPRSCPDTLETFIFIGTRTTVQRKTLPTLWGKSLKYLDLNSNRLGAFPEGLPEILEYANFSNNCIQEIPPREKFPRGLQTLHLGRNRIRQLPSWFSELHKMKFTIQDNFLTVHPDYSHCLYSYQQYVGAVYEDAAKKIQSAWRRQKISSPLRTWRRMAAIKYDLLALAMCPERAGKFEDISPEWFIHSPCNRSH